MGWIAFLVTPLFAVALLTGWAYVWSWWDSRKIKTSSTLSFDKDGSVMVCQGHWPNREVPCLRMLDKSGKCPKEGHPDHLPPGIASRRKIREEERYELIEVTTFDGGVEHIVGQCYHKERIYVWTTGNALAPPEHVADICKDCDAQLEPTL